MGLSDSGWLRRWSQVSEVARKVLATRYRLMPYLYTAFFDSHTYGCPVARPLFFGWPGDNTTRGVNEQWMMGDALLVSPVMYSGASSARVYFPAGTWYNFYTGRATNLPKGTWDTVFVSFFFSSDQGVQDRAQAKVPVMLPVFCRVIEPWRSIFGPAAYW